ncbi:MAG: glycoside hydrolase family 13 protein [Acutalibacteraceae bacterium]
MRPAYDSRNNFYRSPMGAVEEGTKLYFKILVPRSLSCSKAVLNIKHDFDGDWTFIDMFWCGTYQDRYEMWECHYTVEKVGLYWHGFRLQTNEGERFIVPGGPDRKSDIVRSPGASWQITSYKKGFKTPDWPLGGVMYQIFPDRFHFSGNKKENIPQDKTLRENWGELPEWRPNHHGEITNSDFFMGDLQGITEKLDYLEDLGVTCIYLNPIFEAYSNHRYDTGDYSNIDPILGTEEDFITLCKEAEKHGIRVINDGVFSHTGSDSKYFNRKGRYDTVGAYNSQDSEYSSWYHFSQWPNQYNSWWGFYTLPEVNETDPKFNEYINGKDGVIRKWIRNGNSGWRLDVADELPDEFLIKMRKAAKAENPEAFVIGEVWEDASNKESYGHRRAFLLGDQLDSVMNYPFRSAILDFLKGADGKDMMERIMCVVENYPKPVLNVLMNLLGTHDTERALTVLAGEPLYNRDRNWQANTHMTDEQRKRGIKLMKIAAGMLYTLPGFPCVYYGDEVGMEGYKDPFNRGCFPWGHENRDLLDWYKQLGKMRKNCHALREGEMINAYSGGRTITYIRHDEESALFCGFNAGFHDIYLDIPPGYSAGTPLLGTQIRDGKLIIPALGCAFIQL